jgi:orotate phosphoribosyltransferase
LRPEVRGIGGLTLGADPIACAVAPVAWSLGRHLHAFIVRKEAKGYGTRSYLEGRSNFAEEDKVAIVEDVTTTGGSMMIAVDRARASGLNVVQCLTVVDRQEGARELLADHGLVLESLTHRTELLTSDA